MKNVFISISVLISSLFNLTFAQKDDIIFPVELIYFNAMVIDVGVLLRWGTATEVNNFGFEVQRATSSLHFETLDFVQGHGNSNSPKHYIFVDSTLPQPSLYYYRLKQIDIDGSSRYLDTINILYNPLSVKNSYSVSGIKFSFQNNPELKELSISSSENFSDETVLSVFSILGEKVSEFVLPNLIEFKYSYNNLSNGIYFLTLHSKTKLLYSHKFLVIR